MAYVTASDVYVDNHSPERPQIKFPSDDFLDAFFSPEK